jgi:subtilisin family serine protease
MATPLVSGVVALMLAKHKKNGGRSPIKTQDDLINHLRKTAIDLGPAGYDPHYGAGLINPKQVIAVANDGGGGGEQSALATINLLRSDLTESGRAKLDEFLKQVGDADGVDIRIALK